MIKVETRATEYTVSVLPEGHIDEHLFAITVAYRSECLLCPCCPGCPGGDGHCPCECHFRKSAVTPARFVLGQDL